MQIEIRRSVGEDHCRNTRTKCSNKLFDLKPMIKKMIADCLAVKNIKGRSRGIAREISRTQGS